MATQTEIALWERYKSYLYVNEPLGFQLDISRIGFTDAFISEMEPAVRKAFEAMDALEKGAVANPDENRMVGHYWLRNPSLAPDAAITEEIQRTEARIQEFAKRVHRGQVKPPTAERFRHLLVIGIGGSALGPEFVSDALWQPRHSLKSHFFDNTDPDGFDRTLAQIGDGLKETLVVVISKSGGTKETRNGQVEAKEAFQNAGLDPAKHFVAVTQEGSALDKTAVSEGWLERFPMWDWVGGRTSELSAVGLLPAALQGIEIQEMLEGAREMDEATRVHDWRRNPSMMMALCWYWTCERVTPSRDDPQGTAASAGRGKKDMVVLPYRDRLLLFSRYLQQLVMESLGKEKDLDGNVVHQGISVYGNKGSTDQHAYVQQLRDGVPNFFVTFIEVLKDRDFNSMRVEPDVTSGDFLQGFLLGTRGALYEKGRESITLTLDEVAPRTIGHLIALYERTVGFYGSLVNVNAYHQPGVEAGKKAAGEVIDIVQKVIAHLRTHKGQDFSLPEIAEAIGRADDVETVFKVLEHLAANTRIHKQPGPDQFSGRYA